MDCLVYLHNPTQQRDIIMSSLITKHCFRSVLYTKNLPEMATVSFDRLKLVDQRTKDLVEGFIKKASHDIDIPSSIVSVCILFYYLGEFFSTCGDAMKIDDNKTILKACPLARNTGYGNIRINNEYNCIYSWTLKLVALDIYNTWIGIDASNKEYSHRNFSLAAKHYYAIDVRGSKKSRISGQSSTRVNYGKRMKEGDIVKMDINTKDRTMSFWINDEYQGIAFEDVAFDGVEYYLAISLFKQNCEHWVKLLDFRQVVV